MTIPKIKTSAGAAKERAEGAGTSQRAFALELLRAFSHTHDPFPTYDNAWDVERNAAADFRRNDFSEAADYIDSLVKIADYWQNLAENYHGHLSPIATFHDTGEVNEFEPIAVTLNGEEVGGSASVFRLDNEDERKYALEELKKTLARATYEPRRERLANLIAEWSTK